MNHAINTDIMTAFPEHQLKLWNTPPFPLFFFGKKNIFR